MTDDQIALLEEILRQPGFREWAIGEAPEMDGFWKAWVSDNPIRKDILEHAVEITRSFDHDAHAVSEAHILQKVNFVLSGRASRDRENKDERVPFSEKLPRIAGLFKIAAMVLFVMSLGWGAYQYYMPDRPASAGLHSGPVLQQHTGARFRTLKNKSPQRQHIHLSDGSSVILQPGGEITFPEVFPKHKREVSLSGEAFFEVIKNKEVPFYVVASQTVTKVVGTSFRVKAKPGVPFLEINVKSGVVAVFNNRLKEGERLSDDPSASVTLLKESEKAIFELSPDRLRKQAETGPVPARLLIEELSFVYEATPLPDVFADLEAAYGVKIKYEKSHFSGCSLTARLGDEPLYKKIQWISTILEAEYTIEESEITINGKPCQ